MGDLLSRLHSFAAELKRRSVFRIVISYGVIGWLLVQVATNTFPYLGVPSWAITLVIVIVALGFPIAVLLAWAYDLTPAGVVRESMPGDAPGNGPQIRAIPAVEPVAEPGASEAPVHELPLQTNHMVGRQREMEELSELLQAGSRLITITGPGGAGKTRLAIEAARVHHLRFPDGVCFVPLSALPSTELILPTITERLGVTLPAGDVQSQLIRFLREKSLLLVLDNFDSLTEGAPLLVPLLEQAAEITILATSRERLRIHAETVFSIEGLEFQATHGAGPPDSVQLFIESARRFEPRFSPSEAELEEILRICRFVAGLPLAIELAAAWIGTLSCREIREQIEENHDFLFASMRDAPERHRSLRAVFESSWRLLPEPEKEVFRKTSVFRNGFSRQAAEEIAGSTLSTLMGLLNRSLLRRSGPERYEVLEVLRQYAGEKLRERGDEENGALRRHCAYFAEFLDTRAERLRGPHEREALREISLEFENIRRAWTWACKHKDLHSLERMIEGLHLFLFAQGRMREGEEMFAQAAAASSGRVSRQGRPGSATTARLLVRKGIFSAHLGRVKEAREALESGLTELRRRGDDRETALALNNLGRVAFLSGEYAEAERLHLESLELSRADADQAAAGRALVHLGNTAYALGKYGEARALYIEALAIFRAVDDSTSQAVPLCNLGIIAGTEADYPQAMKLLEESLTISREIGDQRMIAHCLHNLGCTAKLAGDEEAAQGYFREGITTCRRMGFDRLLAFCHNELGNLSFDRGSIDEAHEHFRAALSTAIRTGEVPMILESFIGVARLLRSDPGKRERAAELLVLVVNHPGADERARARAREELSDLAPEIPHERLKEAERRGLSLDVGTAIAEFTHDDSVEAILP